MLGEGTPIPPGLGECIPNGWHSEHPHPIWESTVNSCFWKSWRVPIGPGFEAPRFLPLSAGCRVSPQGGKVLERSHFLALRRAQLCRSTCSSSGPGLIQNRQ